MTTNLKICRCGDCEAAVSRAMKMCEQMFVDDECPIFQAAVAGAFSLMASLAMEKLLRAKAKNENIPPLIVEAAIGESVAYNCSTVEIMATEHARSRRDEINKRMKRWWNEHETRLEADHVARKEDSPNIGKPKR